MMQETPKKAYLMGISILIVIGILYAIWLLFLNRGTVSFISDAPFEVQTDQKTELCTQSPCDLVLAPGNNTFTLTKEGYIPVLIQTNVPIWGTYEQTINFIFISIFTEIGLEKDLNLFVDESRPYTAYIERNRENGRQTLYYQSNEPNMQPVLATSFTRDLKDYFISEAIDNHQRIAVVDTTESQSTLYLVDLEQKTRDAILSLPLINGIKWLDKNTILLEGRTDSENEVGLHLYNIQDQSIKKLEIETELTNIESLNDSTLIAATNQPFTSPILNPEGELITLAPSSEESDLIFITYSKDSDNIRLLKTSDKAASCNEIKLSNDHKSLLCLSPAPLGDKVYELTFDK